MREIAKRAIVVLILVGCLPMAGFAQDPLMPDEIISLCNSGKSDAEMISMLQNRGINFEVNLPVVQRFVENGISPGIIQVIMGLSNTTKSSKTYRTFSGKTQPSFSVFSKPDSMNIFVDGVGMGVTPFMSNKLKPGKHQIRVEHPLFFTREEIVDISGEESIILNWNLEPREPVVRIKVNLETNNDDYVWTWIIRPRENCPDEVTLNLKPWRFGASDDEALFVLSDESKRLYKSFGKTCLEVHLWRGEMRRDIPVRDLPPCTARYLISNIGIMGIQAVEMNLKIKVQKIDPHNPEVVLESDTGLLIDTGDRAPALSPGEKRDVLLEDLNHLFSEE